jgi:hypothetical protein
MKSRFQESRIAPKFLLLVVILVLTVSAYSPAESARTPIVPENGAAIFTQLNLHANIETVGVVVSGANLLKAAELFYRLSGEMNWHAGHPLVRIDDGRLLGSLFGLSPATSYEVKVVDGATEITGSVITQPNELQFTPSAILHVNDDAPSGGDGSVSAPFQTIQEGVNHACPGVQVLVSDGIYHEAVTFPASGSAGNWIQVKAEGSGAILDGSENLSGDIWTPHEKKAHVWFTKVGTTLGYLARDQKRFYNYDSLPDLLEGRGHNKVAVNEGWFIEPYTWKLYVRSVDNPSSHTWQVPRRNHAFDVDGREWLWIEGFEMQFYGTNTEGCGVCTTNASHVVIRRNKIHNMQLGIFVKWNGSENQGNDTRIEFNEIYDPSVAEWPWNAIKGSSMEGTAIVVRGHIGAIVRGNDLHHFFNGIYTGSSAALENPAIAFDADIYENHIHHILDDGLEPEGACVNQRFRNNTVDSTLVGISLAPVTQGPVWVLRSLFINYTGTSIKWDLNSDGIVLIYHNTSWTNSVGLNAMSMIRPVHNAVLRNNIFQGNGFAFEEPFTGSTGQDWNYDNWYTTRASPHFKWENIPYNTIGELCAATGLECQGHEDAPGLTNPNGGDFTLFSSSLNIDRGVMIPGINDNFAGSAPDVGAYEVAADHPPSVLSSLRAEADPSNSSSVNFTVTFSESVTGVDIVPPFSDFTLVTGSGISGASITSVTSTSGITYLVNLNTGTGNGILRLEILDDDSIVDAAGNPLGGPGAGNGSYSTGEFYTLEKGLPIVTGIIRLDPNPTTADVVRFTVNFTKEVIGVDAGDFILESGGSISSSMISEVIGFGTNYTVTVITGTGDGTLRLDILDNDSILDAINNPLGGVGVGNGSFSAGEFYTIDKSMPVVTGILRADSDPTTADLIGFRIGFSEAVTGVDAGDFILTTTGGITGVTITAIGLEGAGNTYLIVISTGSGNGTVRLDLIDNDSIMDSGGHPLAGVGSGNGNFSSGEVYTINRVVAAKVIEIFRSNGTNDGWVLESKEESNQGGTRNSGATTFNLGDNRQDCQYRSILHFHTASIPDNAVITMVILMIRRQDRVGIDPFTTHQNIAVDIRSGYFGLAGFFGIYGLDLTDFQSPASMDSVGVIRNNPVNGWYWSMLDNTAHPYINLTGVTQFRLGFQLDDNEDRGDDYLKFYSGNYRAQSDRPQLQVEYYVP